MEALERSSDVFKEVHVCTRPLAAHPCARGCLGKESREHGGGGWWSRPAGGRRSSFPRPWDRATALNPYHGRGAGPLLPQENSQPHTRLRFRRCLLPQAPERKGHMLPHTSFQSRCVGFTWPSCPDSANPAGLMWTQEAGWWPSLCRDGQVAGWVGLPGLTPGI